MPTKILTVNDINGNFYGGLPYNISWDFNDGSSPSTLSVSVVSENGQYPNIDNELTFEDVARVTIGSFVFNGYLVSYDINKSPDQKILNLKYVDKSADLDRWYVGLYKRHGLQSGGAKNLIIVGKEYHPCDKDYDSTVSYQELNQTIIDPCDPCPYTPENKYQSTCDQTLADFQILDVYYTFNELLGKLPLSYDAPSNINNRFRAQHTGKLKDVLGAWCSDLGLAYYWDPIVNKLFFVDRKHPLKIPAISNLEKIGNLIDLQYGGSKQNTFSRGFLGYFAKEGLVKNYPCELSQNQSFQTLNCLTMKDLLDPSVYSEENPSGVEFIKLKELEAALSYYGRSVRDAFIWFRYYAILNANTAGSYYKIQKDENNQESPDQRNKILGQFGNMKILDVYSAVSNSANFVSCKKKLAKEDLKTLQDFDKKNNRDPLTNPSYYFFVAEVNEELAEKQFSDAEYMAKNFLGKFWHKKFNTPIPGATNSRTQISAESPDGNAQWYPARQDLNGLDIFNFGHQSGSLVAGLKNDLTSDQQENQDPFTQANGGDKDRKIRASSSFLLLNRDAKWSPSGDDLKYYDSLFKWYEDHLPKAFGNSEGRPNFLFRLFPEARNNTNIKLFFARELNSFSAKISKSAHPLDTPAQTDKLQSIESTNGDQISKSLGKYGLKSNQCARITLPGMEIFTPSQCLSDLDNFNDGDSGYDIYLEATTNFTKVIPKVQYTITKDINSTNVAQIDYYLKEIREDNLNLIRGNSKNCIIPEEDIKNYVDSIYDNSSYEMTEVQKTASFKVAGLMPVQYTVSDGLSSIQITVSDNGIYTSYSFEDKVVQPPSEDYIMQNLIDKIRPVGSLNGNMPTTNEINFLKDSGI
jgi:hypothetical protein